MEGSLTLGEIFKIIIKRIWWVLGATAVCLAVTVMVTQLWYNKGEQYYTINYEIVYPDSASGKYPDGSDLIVSDSISLETLGGIKEKDGFKGIDVKDMHANDGISVKESVIRSEDGNIRRLYSLTVKAKYFSSKSQANSFMRTVAEYPVNRVNSIIANKEYSANLVGYNDAPSYDEKISALTAQKGYLDNEYSKLSSYGEKAEAGKASLRNIFTSEQQSDIRAHISAGKYVLDTEGYKINAETRKDTLDKQIADNVKIIEAEEAKRGDSNPNDVNTNPYDQLIAEYTRKNAEMANEIQAINDTLTEIEKYTQEGTDEYKAKQAFDARLDGYYSKLAEATETLKTVSVSIYSDNSRVVFSVNKLEKQGGIHWAAAVFLGALIGLIISSVVVCIIDAPKYKRAKLAAAEGQEQVKEENEEVK